MIDEKKFADEVLNEEELDGVAGGTSIETITDGDELRKRGFLNENDEFWKVSVVCKRLKELGYKYVTHSGLKELGGKGNEYFNKAGEPVSREEFWKNFNAENGINPEGGSRIL